MKMESDVMKMRPPCGAHSPRGVKLPVNSPRRSCIEMSSSILKVLIPRMLSDAFKLTLDEHFPEMGCEQDL